MSCEASHSAARRDEWRLDGMIGGSMGYEKNHSADRWGDTLRCMCTDMAMHALRDACVNMAMHARRDACAST
jgi:hypothetical protein